MGVVIMTRKEVNDMALAIFFAKQILDDRVKFNRVPKKLRDKVLTVLKSEGFDVNDKGELVEIKD